MKNKKPNIDFIFEVSWEVCNKIGGIYTVLSTRAKTLQEAFPEKIIFIGPDFENYDNSELFIADDSLFETLGIQNSELRSVVRAGRWNVPGKPIALLIRFEGFEKEKDHAYWQMWNNYQVDSLHAYGDYEEATLFSIASSTLIQTIYEAQLKTKRKNIIAHFNEWTTGMGALLLQTNVPQIATVFTTHATSIGRSIAGNQKPLYDYLEDYNGNQMAEELNMQSKHSLERATAHAVDCFTTVSDITNLECKHLLDKEVDVVTPNGFEFDFVPTPRKHQSQRKEVRNHIAKLYNKLTGKALDDNTFIVGTSGRYEYKNKGIDLFIDSLNRLKWDNSLDNHSVLGLVLVPAWVKDPRKDILQRMEEMDKVFKKPLRHPYITHNLHNEYSDNVLGQVQYLNLTNAKNSDKVELIFVPVYLNGKDPIVPFEYYDFLQGLDLTVFPSYYEPWGYTPLESVSFGIPTVTTSLSGFGVWAQGEIPTEDLSHGVKVIIRHDNNQTEVSEQIKETILSCLSMNQTERKAIFKASQALSKKADWKLFIDHYYNAYNQALANAKKRAKK